MSQEADDRAKVQNLREMLHGLLCGRCVLEASYDLTRPPAEWQAITIIDGTALCAQHVIAKARADTEREMARLRAESEGDRGE
ncbi:hypothetical protein AB0K40_17875 [Nonomuraea bangladeshensis]|uniref:Uncharacterized protein n=1 Tax=Nonomuraea bangladeshensis TaxID=404385 RepID=A0ABV3H4B9_9ACTN